MRTPLEHYWNNEHDVQTKYYLTLSAHHTQKITGGCHAPNNKQSTFHIVHSNPHLCPRDSSVGRAFDCRGKKQDIKRSLVRFRFARFLPKGMRTRKYGTARERYLWLLTSIFSFPRSSFSIVEISSFSSRRNITLLPAINHVLPMYHHADDDGRWWKWKKRSGRWWLLLTILLVVVVVVVNSCCCCARVW